MSWELFINPELCRRLIEDRRDVPEFLGKEGGGDIHDPTCEYAFLVRHESFSFDSGIIDISSRLNPALA